MAVYLIDVTRLRCTVPQPELNTLYIAYHTVHPIHCLSSVSECALCSECKKTVKGREYMGRLSTTASGWRCQSWSSNWPHKKNEAASKDASYPDGRIAAARNYCRNPDNSSGGPWCYTTDPNRRWEYCAISFCA